VEQKENQEKAHDTVGKKPSGKCYFMRLRMLTALLLLSGAAVSAAVYPLKLDALHPRRLVDQRNAPFLLVGDAPHSLLVNLAPADAAFYLADRRAHGFNSLWVELLCVPYTGGRSDGSLLNGVRPFTRSLPNGEFDLSSPNESFFAYVDTLIRMAATNDIQIMLDPLDTGGLMPTALDNGPDKCRAFGRYLGNRYRTFPNLIWLNGNDFGSWGEPNKEAVITAIALGIRDEDTNHLQTVEFGCMASHTWDDPNWRVIAGLNLAYTYYPTYAEVLSAWRQSTNNPVFMGEAHYEFESMAGDASEEGTPPILRRQEYWAMLSGAVGQVYGNGFTWPFKPGWREHLDSPGVAQLQHGTALFSALPWFDLVPDVQHTFLTSGFGTYSEVGKVSASDYVTAALSEDGTLGMAYLPVLGTVTINMARLRGPMTARWFDPADGTYHPTPGPPLANTGSHDFTPPGKNSGGDGDWVLVLTVPATAAGRVK
jgi:hypothetical protein